MMMLHSLENKGFSNRIPKSLSAQMCSIGHGVAACVCSRRTGKRTSRQEHLAWGGRLLSSWFSLCVR